MKKLLLLTAVVALQLQSFNCFSHAGSLDNSFNTDGIPTTASGSYDSYGFSVAIQADGKIVVAGFLENDLTTEDSDFALVRYNKDGSLDTTFDTDGKLTTDFGYGFDQANSVVIQLDGKIVVAGTASNGINAGSIALVRYNSNGSLDNTFDTDGKLTTDFGYGFDQANSVAIQTDGKILVSGYSNNGSIGEFTLVRYNNDGSLDNTFDTDGKVTTLTGIGYEVGTSVAVQPNGKIVVAGRSYTGTITEFAVVRYNADGPSGMNNSFSDADFAIYPNPFSGQTILRSDNSFHDATLIVHNSIGQRVKEVPNISGQTVILTQDNLQSGIYFIRLTEENKTTVFNKLIITD